MTSYNSYTFQHIEKTEKENIKYINDIIIDDNYLCENFPDSINFKNYLSLLLNIHDSNKHLKTFINFRNNTDDCLCCGENSNIRICKSEFIIEYRVDNTLDLCENRGLYINITSNKDCLYMCEHCKYNIEKMQEKKEVSSCSIQNTENKIFKNIIYIIWKKDKYPLNIVSILQK